MALYDQIEKKTVENLQIAQKNTHLEIQIQTIDEILQEQYVYGKGRGGERGGEENRGEERGEIGKIGEREERGEI